MLANERRFMIKAEELRIGNLVSSIYLGYDNIIVKNIHNDCINLNGITLKCYNLDQIQGIPLAEEWLIKFGFASTLNSYTYGNGVKALYYSKEGCDMAGVQLKYVHQLQNLYFCLTGDELTIKP